MTDLVKLRPATPGDEEALGRLGRLLVAEHHEFDGERSLMRRGDITAAYGRFRASQLSREEAVVLVADRDGNVVGYVVGALQCTPRPEARVTTTNMRPIDAAAEEPLMKKYSVHRSTCLSL
jgi:hypothetical protein